MPAPKPDPAEQALDDALVERTLGEGPDASIDELVAAEDVEGLLELGAAYRLGAGPIPRDAFKAVECFEAASRLGHAEAEYFVGVAHMNGLGVAKDLAEGVKRMRSAAQRGSLRAKVYVANLYEMGVHYAADRDKADVWYRNVARAAGIDDDPETDAYGLEMAELGCVRFCLKLVADEALPTKDRAFYLKRAKAMGYSHRLAQTQPEPAEPAPPAEAAPEEPTPPEPDAQREAKPEAKAEAATDEDEDDDDERAALGAQWTIGAGLGAFVVAALFAVASFYTGWLASEGSRALAAAGRALPGIGAMHDLVFAAVLVAFGVLPATSVYRPKVVGIATVVGGAAAAGGWFLHPSTPLLWSPAAQAGAAGLAGLAVVLLFLGLLGGTRATR